MRAPAIACAALLLAVVVCSGARAGAQESCGAGKDLVVQALEHLKADSPPDQLLNADELLKRAAELCSELGPAWYYRSLVEAKLGHARVADYAMRQAKMFPSAPLQQGLNPFVLASPKGSAPLGPIEHKWALVIGLNHFRDTSLDPLSYGVSDAKSVAATLTDPKYGKFAPDHVHLLTDAEATTVGIKEQLNWLARVAQPQDLVVVYIATHGSPRDMDTREANYLVTYDTDIGTAQDTAEKSQDKLYATAYPMVDLSDAMATRVLAKRAVLLIDTCYSGGAGAARGLKPVTVSTQAQEQATQGAGRVVIAAASREQESQESKSLQHGYFTYYLVQALKQVGGDAPVDKVFDYVKTNVSKQVAQDTKAYGSQYAQTPVMSRSSDNTDFLLETAPAAASAAKAPGAKASVAGPPKPDKQETRRIATRPATAAAALSALNPHRGM